MKRKWSGIQIPINFQSHLHKNGWISLWSVLVIWSLKFISPDSYFRWKGRRNETVTILLTPFVKMMSRFVQKLPKILMAWGEPSCDGGCCRWSNSISQSRNYIRFSKFVRIYTLQVSSDVWNGWMTDIKILNWAIFQQYYADLLNSSFYVVWIMIC